MHCAPDIAAQIVVGVPASDDYLLSFIKGCYNQGSLPSCVAHSSAGMQSINEQMERGQWIIMDAVKAYYDNGGNGSNGVPTQAVLSYMQGSGMPVVGSSLRYKLSTYAFCQPMQPAGIEALKAAISTGHPCVLAMLLPSDFMNGMTAGQGSVNRVAYHQVCCVGYTPERVTFLNSWGPGYGQNGLGSVPWSYLARPEQANYVYAYTEVDSPDDDIPPPPPPPPPPVDFTITGYQGAAAVVQQFSGGGPLTISGTGLNDGALQILFGSSQLPVGLRSDTSVLVTLPAVEVPICGQIKVQRGAVAVTGPLLVVTPNGAPPPPPPPVGDLQVSITISKRQTVVGIYVTVHDGTGGLVDAGCWGTCGSSNLPQKPAHANGVPAVWQVTRHNGDVVTLTAVDGRGRRGVGTATI